MLKHAARGVPWLVVLAGVVPVPMLLRVVEEWPFAMWPLQGIAVGLVAATSAWCFDETAATVVDTLPRSLAWRTLSRLLGVALILAVWLVSVQWTSTAYFERAGHVAGQGVAAIAVGSAYTTWRRRRGTATPARGVATWLVCGAAYLALARPLEDRLPVFPYLSTGPWQASAVLWAVVGVVSLAVLVVVLLEPAGQDRRNGSWW